jgi:hypothetical protein
LKVNPNSVTDRTANINWKGGTWKKFLFFKYFWSKSILWTNIVLNICIYSFQILYRFDSYQTESGPHGEGDRIFILQVIQEHRCEGFRNTDGAEPVKCWGNKSSWTPTRQCHLHTETSLLPSRSSPVEWWSVSVLTLQLPFKKMHVPVSWALTVQSCGGWCWMPLLRRRLPSIMVNLRMAQNLKTAITFIDQGRILCLWTNGYFFLGALPVPLLAVSWNCKMSLHLKESVSYCTPNGSVADRSTQVYFTINKRIYWHISTLCNGRLTDALYTT